jgi:hypothetical protein
MKEKAFDIAHQNRNFEIEHFWKRALFFWGFMSTAFAGYLASKKFSPELSIFLSSFGLICAFSWTLANRGSKYWQEYWERKVELLGDDVIGELFVDEEPHQSGDKLWDSRKFSVSKLTIAVSDYLVIIWLLVLAYEANLVLGCTELNQELIAKLVMIFTALYMLIMFLATRSRKEQK